MKRLLFSLSCTLIMLCSCQSQLSMCEKVTKPSDLPWMEEMIRKAEERGVPITTIVKVYYTIGESKTTNVGYRISWETPAGYDIIGAELCDCEGNHLASYGGYAGCTGLCNITITSQITIYSRE